MRSLSARSVNGKPWTRGLVRREKHPDGDDGDGQENRDDDEDGREAEQVVEDTGADASEDGGRKAGGVRLPDVVRARPLAGEFADERERHQPRAGDGDPLCGPHENKRETGVDERERGVDDRTEADRPRKHEAFIVPVAGPRQRHDGDSLGEREAGGEHADDEAAREGEPAEREPAEREFGDGDRTRVEFVDVLREQGDERDEAETAGEPSEIQRPKPETGAVHGLCAANR